MAAPFHSGPPGRLGRHVNRPAATIPPRPARVTWKPPDSLSRAGRISGRARSARGTVERPIDMGESRKRTEACETRGKREIKGGPGHSSAKSSGDRSASARVSSLPAETNGPQTGRSRQSDREAQEPAPRSGDGRHVPARACTRRRFCFEPAWDKAEDGAAGQALRRMPARRRRSNASADSVARSRRPSRGGEEGPSPRPRVPLAQGRSSPGPRMPQRVHDRQSLLDPDSAIMPPRGQAERMIARSTEPRESTHCERGGGDASSGRPHRRRHLRLTTTREPSGSTRREQVVVRLGQAECGRRLSRASSAGRGAPPATAGEPDDMAFAGGLTVSG